MRQNYQIMFGNLKIEMRTLPSIGVFLAKQSLSTKTQENVGFALKKNFSSSSSQNLQASTKEASSLAHVGTGPRNF